MEENKIIGTEKIGKLLLKFSIPCVASLLISSLYNIVDQIFVGNSSLGYLGNAATGAVFPILIVTQAFAWCFGDGCAAYLSICQGRKETEKANKAIGTGITLTLIASLLIILFSLIFAEPILRFCGASDKTYPLAYEYLKIVAAFFPFYMLQMMMNGIIRSDGAPLFAMLSTGVGAIINIILDPLFIYVFDWGIQGAAWATAIGQVISFVIGLIYFFRSKTFCVTLKSFIPDFKAFKEPLSLGISSFITQISIAVVNLVGNAMLVKYGNLSVYGQDIPISITSIETKVFTVVLNIVVGIVLGGLPIIGYNIGAGKTNRVRHTYFLILMWTIGISAVATLLFELWPDIIIKIFGGKDDPLYMEYGRLVFRLFLATTMLTCFIKMSSIFFQACGKPVKATIASLVRDIVFFVPAVMILPAISEKSNPGSGIVTLLYAPMIADTLAFFIALSFTFLLFKELGKEDDSKVENVEIQNSHPGVILTISREHGSQGKGIGEIVASELNIPFYSKELLSLAAEKSGLTEKFLSNTSSPKQGVPYNLYLSKSVESQSIEAQKEVLLSIAEKGSCVIVGRAADYVLRDNPNVVSIFIYASEEIKIRNIMEMYHDDYEEAKKRMKQSDKTRARYYQSISSLKWDDRHHYDLCIDSSIGKEMSAKMILDYLKQREVVEAKA